MEDLSISVSKGIFVFKNGDLTHHKRTKSKQSDFVDNHKVFSHTQWFRSYRKLWNTIEEKLENLNNDMFASLLTNLVLSIKNSYNNPVTEIPAIALLTGINMPDHSALFSTLSKEIRKTVSPHVAVLHAVDCQNLKHVVESTVNQLVNDDRPDEETEWETDTKSRHIRKPQCTLALLSAWYENLYGSVDNRVFSSVKRKTRDGQKPLVVIIPDFESFNDSVIQDFILVLSSYFNTLPFVLVFGVATSVSAVHKALPYHVSSKISVEIFNSQPSTTYLNNVIEHVFFTDDCPFHLGGKIFNLFTDIFLFYDLSVKGFIKNFKFAMTEHYSYGNLMALCTNSKNLKKTMEQFSQNDLENIRKLPSFQNHAKTNNDLLELDDAKFKYFVCEQLQDIGSYLNYFHLFLKCLHVLVQDLPKTPLGKQVRELYSLATCTNITKTPEFKECFQLVAFQSKDELYSKVTTICKIIEDNIATSKINKTKLEEILEEVEVRLEKLENATTVHETEQEAVDTPEDNLILGTMNRKQLKEKLLGISKKAKPMNKYEQARSELVKYLQTVFEAYLEEPSSKVFYEIFFFNDMSIKNHIIGSHRAAIHTALNDPQHYLQCKCCELQNEGTILASMPDISILYKLHLEYVDSDDGDDEENEEGKKKFVKPELQARFTQAVADLEFLGFIKNSKRKTDHVARLTWGG